MKEFALDIIMFFQENKDLISSISSMCIAIAAILGLTAWKNNERYKRLVNAYEKGYVTAIALEEKIQSIRIHFGIRLDEQTTNHSEILDKLLDEILPEINNLKLAEIQLRLLKQSQAAEILGSTYLFILEMKRASHYLDILNNHKSGDEFDENLHHRKTYFKEILFAPFSILTEDAKISKIRKDNNRFLEIAKSKT